MAQQQSFSADSFENGGVPRPVVPPRGLSGVLDGYDATEILDTSQFPPNMVLLNVYDLARDVELFQKINKVTTGNNNALIGGLFHAGVEIYGLEWCYGFADDGRSGVSHVMPRSHPQHAYRTTVPMGVTHLGAREVRVLLGRLSEEWPGWEYHLFHCNCLNFSNALCAELGVGRIPGWVDRAARAAAALDTGYRGAVDGANKTAALARKVTQDLDVTVRSAIPTDAEDAQAKAGEALDVVQRRSVIAIEVAQSQAQVLAEAAQVQAQELREKAQPAVEQTSAFVRAKTADLGEKANELLGEELSNKAQEHAAAIGEKAQEIGGKAQEHAQAIGASLWSGFRDLHRAATEIGTPANTADAERSPGQDWGFGSFVSQAVGSVEEATSGQRSFGREAAPPCEKEDVGSIDECESLLDMPGVVWHEEPAAQRAPPAAAAQACAPVAAALQVAPASTPAAAEADPLDEGADDMFFGAGEPSAPAAPVASSTGSPGADLLG